MLRIFFIWVKLTSNLTHEVLHNMKNKTHSLMSHRKIAGYQGKENSLLIKAFGRKDTKYL